MKHYTHKDVGCYIDGAFGPRHAMQVMAYMIGTLIDPKDDTEREAWAILQDADMSPTFEGEADQAFDIAEEILYRNTEEGLVWIWEAGDLVLTSESEVTD